MALVGAARRLGVSAKAREVRGSDRVVVRDGEAIGALLTRMGAQDTRLTWEERRMRREVRATANRLANFDDANLRRSARAAVAAAARVERALDILGDTVPDHLSAAGRLRVEHRQASLEELGLSQVNLRYVGGDGRLKTVAFPINSREHLGEVLTRGERVDGSSVFPGPDTDASDVYIVPRHRTAFLNPFGERCSLDVLCSFYAPDGTPLP